MILAASSYISDSSHVISAARFLNRKKYSFLLNGNIKKLNGEKKLKLNGKSP
jgi:hypothetical protein